MKFKPLYLIKVGLKCPTHAWYSRVTQQDSNLHAEVSYRTNVATRWSTPNILSLFLDLHPRDRWVRLPVSSPYFVVKYIANIYPIGNIIATA